jgi:hypothetical protein
MVSVEYAHYAHVLHSFYTRLSSHLRSALLFYSYYYLQQSKNAMSKLAAEGAKGGGDRQKKEGNKNISCALCDDVLEHNHTFIKCPQGHHLCKDDSATYIEHTMGSNDLPAKCCLCKTEIASNIFEMNLPQKYRDQFVMFNAMNTIGENEKILQCPSCSWFAVGYDEPPLFLKCQGKCGQVSCYHCKVSVPGNNPPQTEEEELAQAAHIPHADPELNRWYKRWQDAEQSQTVACPNSECNVPAGLKDDACLHMTCNACNTQYCYFCKLKIDQCDQATAAELAQAGAGLGMSPIYRHNVNWVENRKRCPMYLTELSEVDAQWPHGDDQACVERLSRLQALKALSDVYNEMGDAVFQRLQAAFGPVKATLNVFPLDEIQAVKPMEEWIARP